MRILRSGHTRSARWGIVYSYSYQVWHIPQTGELFTSYEDYLSRFVSSFNTA